MAKAELQEGRLSNASRLSAGRKGPAAAGQSLGGSGLTSLEELKLTQLRQKKERLSYAVERLELQASQRERQLRKSMAFQ
jgi:DASH complex subunit SPC19